MTLPYPQASKSIANALFIEHQAQRIITEQAQNGVLYNKARGRFYIFSIRERKEFLRRKIRPHLSLQVSRPYAVPVSKPFVASGGYSLSARKWFGEESEELGNVSGPFSRVEFVEPNLGSRQQLIGQLLLAGWKPQRFTEKGNPKLTVDGEPCPSLMSISTEFGRWIAEWYILNHRESQLLGFDKRIREDGRISADAIVIGTPTFRMRHKNVVNIPRKSTLYGPQMRSLFCAPKGRRFVGFDAKGLELRMLAHDVNDPEYTRHVTTGDPHVKHQQDAGLPSKDNAKTFIYAFIYGAGDGKIGSIIGGSAADGRRIKSAFLNKNPALRDVISEFERAAGRGYLIGIDGRRLQIRRDKKTGDVQKHKALNVRLQSGGAIVMKYAMYFLDMWIREMGLDAKKVIDMHDEGQYETSASDAHTVGRLGCLAISQAGRHLGLNLPLQGAYAVGLNWKHTH